MKQIPQHYRKLGPDEIPKRGDYYKFDKEVDQWSGKFSYPSRSYPGWQFFRRKHVAVKATPSVAKKNPNGKLVVVEFEYPSHDSGFLKTREVQLIGMDSKYVTGLEITNLWNKKEGKYTPKFQFKKFLRSRIYHSGIILKKYGNDD